MSPSLAPITQILLAAMLGLAVAGVPELTIVILVAVAAVIEVAARLAAQVPDV